MNILALITYPLLFMFFHYHYKYLHNLAILEEDANGANLGNSIRPYSCDFLGHGSCLAVDHVGR